MITEAASAPQWFHFDTPRTGSKWPPYENADKGFWALEAEKLEEHKRVKKVAVTTPSQDSPPVKIPVDVANDSKSSKKPQKTLAAKVVSVKIATRR